MLEAIDCAEINGYKKVIEVKSDEIVWTSVVGRFKIESKEWLDKDTLLIQTDDHNDEDGDVYHVDVEFHYDEFDNGSVLEYAVHFSVVFEDQTITEDLQTEWINEAEKQGFIKYIKSMVE